MTDVSDALVHLERHQTQLDMDGVMVGVSRQALDILISFARDALAAAEAKLATAEPVAVKPLEWFDFERGAGSQYADSCFGRYDAWCVAGSGYLRRPQQSSEGAPYGTTLDAAKAAAQADYEARIRSALYAAPPAAEPVKADYFGGLVERARNAAEKASRKFPQPNYVTLKIAEEAGEVVRGCVHYAENRMEWSEVEGEIVQLLAMLIRLVTEGDQINGVTPPAMLAAAPALTTSPEPSHE